MEHLRTPDESFKDLPGFPFEPHYVQVDNGAVDNGAVDDGAVDNGAVNDGAVDGKGGGASLRVHYLDEGPRDGEAVLLMHGEPSWSYLYRHMIPALVEAGLRCVAPDLVGFGRSDKPSMRGDYSYARHVEWMRQALFDAIGLEGITLVGQDWGGLIGLRLVAEHPERFTRVVAANTGLPTGDQPLSDAFFAWQRFSQEAQFFPVGAIVSGGCTSELSPEVIAAYDAPFPNDRFKEGARAFPVLVPTAPDDPATAANRRAWEVLAGWDKPFLTAFSDGDPITNGGEAVFQRNVPGARGQPHTTINGAGHFLQEDRGRELAEVVASWIASTPAS